MNRSRNYFRMVTSLVATALAAFLASTPVMANGEYVDMTMQGPTAQQQMDMPNHPVLQVFYKGAWSCRHTGVMWRCQSRKFVGKTSLGIVNNQYTYLYHYIVYTATGSANDMALQEPYNMSQNVAIPVTPSANFE